MAWTEDVQWDLESIVPGGVAGQEFAGRAEALEAEAAALLPAADALGEPGEDPAWDTVIPALLALSQRTIELHMFAMCHASTHVTDSAAWRAEARISAITTRIERAWTTPRDRVARCSDAAFEALCGRPALADTVPMFADLRAAGPLLLPPGEQALYTELSEDGIGAWGRLYERIAGRVSVPVTLNGVVEHLSVSQANNRMEDPDAAVRAAVLAGVTEGWKPHLELCAEMLTHIFGTRAVHYKRLGVDELAEPLAVNRVQAATLDAIFETAATARPLVQRYLAAKARLLGVDRMNWSDLRAPVGRLSRGFGWRAAQDFVVTQFATFSDDMASFAADAFQRRWVEAEDRAGKRPGAYCAPMPQSGQSRIFMTFGGQMNSVITLAHELGHAYHNHAMRHLPFSRQNVTSSLAETASTFAESLVRGAMLKSAADEGEELAILDVDLSDAVSFLANIPVRFHFERALHRLRAGGDLDPDVLSSTMDELQRTWYGPILGATHPLFWADKLHFYLSDNPFYNFPYSFGYLFSSLVNVTATREGKRWAQGYVDLLGDTGSGPAERVAQVHLGVDLRQASTWSPVLERIEERLTRYEALAAR